MLEGRKCNNRPFEGFILETWKIWFVENECNFDMLSAKKMVTKSYTKSPSTPSHQVSHGRKHMT